jgi:hypothetical protein
MDTIRDNVVSDVSEDHEGQESSSREITLGFWWSQSPLTRNSTNDCNFFREKFAEQFSVFEIDENLAESGQVLFVLVADQNVSIEEHLLQLREILSGLLPVYCDLSDHGGSAWVFAIRSDGTEPPSLFLRVFNGDWSEVVNPKQAGSSSGGKIYMIGRQEETISWIIENAPFRRTS